MNKIIFSIVTISLICSCKSTPRNEPKNTEISKIEDIQLKTDESTIDYENNDDTVLINTIKSKNAKEDNIINYNESVHRTSKQNEDIKVDAEIETIPQEANKIIETDSKEETKPNHSIFDGLLKKHVSATGKVNYNSFKNDLKTLNDYINYLCSIEELTDWSKNEKLTYWINLYNATTIKLILDHYPVKSITNLYNGKPWDQKLIKIGTKSYTLNNIENDIIRPRFKDARIHFAVNCAAKSCPKLMNGAFIPEKLNFQLEQQAKKFINGPENELSADAIKISKIFEWYKEDFENGDIVTFLNKYSNIKINPNATITYKEYDWSLNN